MSCSITLNLISEKKFNKSGEKRMISYSFIFLQCAIQNDKNDYDYFSIVLLKYLLNKSIYIGFIFKIKAWLIFIMFYFISEDTVVWGHDINFQN